MSPSVEPTSTTIVNTQDYTDQLGQLIKIMKNFDNSLKNLQLVVDKKIMGTVANEQQNLREMVIKTVRGEAR